MKNTLYWVTNDLRINDNEALNLAAKSERLLCVYIVDKSWFSVNKFQSKHMDEKRWDFLQDSLDDLNQQLYIVYGHTLSTLVELCNKYSISNLITTKSPGTYETGILTKHYKINPTAAAIIMTVIVCIFEVLFHIKKPIYEALGMIVASPLLSYLTIKTRSLWPALTFHLLIELAFGFSAFYYSVY